MNYSGKILKLNWRIIEPFEKVSAKNIDRQKLYTSSGLNRV